MRSATFSEEVMHSIGPTPPRWIYAEVNTFEDLRSAGALVSDWVRRAHDSLLGPFVEHVRKTAPVPSASVRSEWGAAGEHWVGLSPELFAGARTVVWPYNVRNLTRLLEDLETGKLRRLNISSEQLDEFALPSVLGGFHLGVDLAGYEFEGAAHSLVLGASRALYGDAFTREVQECWVALFRDAAVAFRASTGYMTLDYASYYSPYEQAVGRSWLDGLEESRSMLRGYYWGNLLSSEHLRALGGIERVSEEAPCFLVESLSSNREELAYLQLTPQLDDVPDASLAKLKEYLAPLLPAGTPGYDYAGPPLRIV